jgi:hypothetical protein
MTFEKLLTLKNVLDIADVNMNLMFGSLLSKNSLNWFLKVKKFKPFIKIILIREGFFSDEHFKMNVMTIKTIYEKGNNNASYFYLLKFPNI